MTFNRLTLIGSSVRTLNNDLPLREHPTPPCHSPPRLLEKIRTVTCNPASNWHRAIVWGEKFSQFAATLKKGAHVQVEGPLRSREYDKDGVTHRSYECKVASILKLDRARIPHLSL